MAKSAYVSYIAVIISLLLLLHIVAANQPVPFPCGAPTPNPRITGDTEGTSVKLTTTCVKTVETVALTDDPSGASTYTTLRSSHERYARNDLPDFFSALSRNLFFNFRSHLTAFSSFSHLHLHPREWPPFVALENRLSQIPNSLTHRAMNAPSVMKRYCVSGYTSLIDSIAAVKSAMAWALIKWNMRMDHIAASNGWSDSLPPPYSLLPPSRIPLSGRSSPETGLLPVRQTELALRMEYSLCAHVGRTAQRTTVLASWIVLREVRKWEVVGKTAVWVVQLGRRAWGWLVILSLVFMALLAVLVLLGLVWWLKLWFQAATGFVRQIRG